MSIDVAIIVGFLVLNLTLGIAVGSGIKTIKEYAIGDRNFSTATIVATLIATWISGSYFTVCISQTYTEGVWFIPAAIADAVSSLMIAYIFAPRMKEFFGSLSIAETMGNLFGKHVRTITAISSIAQSVGMMALQIKVFSTIFSYFFGVSSLYATCISSCVVIFYSAWGGIRAVTFTDIIQFFTFGMFIPLFLLFISKTFGDLGALSHAVQTNPLLDFAQLLNWHDPKFLPNLIIFLWFLVPNINATTFQRILMTKNTKQITSSFTIATFGSLAVALLTCTIGVVVLSVNQDLNADNILMYVLDNYSFDGLRGLTLIGIIAMVMSTADSWINTGSVVFAHDLCKPLGIKFKDELFLARAFVIFSGFGALLLVLFSENLFKLFTLQSSFYMPVVTVPFLLAICGFRSSGKSVVLGMAAGALCVMAWKVSLEATTGVDAIIPAMFFNLITLMGSHYFLRQPGGWVGIKDDSDLQQLKREREYKKIASRAAWHNLFHTNILDYCNKYLPKNEMVYVYFAFAVIMTTVITTLSLEKEVYQENLVLVNILMGAALFIGAIFLCHKLWLVDFKKKYMGIIWYISMLIGLAFISSFFALISKFSQVSLLICLSNLTIIGLLVSWRSTLFMVVAGIGFALLSYENYIGDTPDIFVEMPDMKLNIAYISFAIGILLITFLKSRQEREELIEEMKDHLQEKLDDQTLELHKSNDLKHEFLRNLQHEAHTPITGITSMGQVLWENYDKLTEKQRRQATKDISDSSMRLSSLIDSLIDLSKLSSMTYALNRTKVDLSVLLAQRIEACKRMYMQDKDLEFALDIDRNITLNCDAHYMSATFDHLIGNAIQYTPSGKMTISLKEKDGKVEFSILDEGIGIPKEDLYDIFSAFTVSSKTHSKSGGRGIGLTIAKKSIEAHNGEIWAESDGESGSLFVFRIPRV